MVTALGFADAIWLLFLSLIFYAALPNVEGSDPGYIEENKQRLYRCNLDGTGEYCNVGIPLPVIVKKPSSIVLNWKVDPENMAITWDSNVTMDQCSVDTPPKSCEYENRKLRVNRTCYIKSVPLHKGATFIAKIKYLNQTLSDSIYFPPEEMDGTSAENFSCVLYNVSFLNCSWNAGRNAPEDVQYFLYLKHDFGKKRECPCYMNNALGRHIACHIPETTFTSYYIYMNGSSKKSQIRYYDMLLNLCHHERIGPPQNIIKNCSELLSKCRIQWTRPLNNKNCCCCCHYEIKDETKDTTEYISEDYQNIDVEERHIVRIRAIKKTVDITIYGEWSEPIILDFPSQSIPSPIVTLILIAGGTILMMLILVFICKRYHLWHRLTAPVPQPKDLLHQYTKNTEKELGDPIPTRHEPDEKITMIEEVTDGFKK